MKKTLCLILMFLLPVSALAADFTDALGREISLESPKRVVSLYGSYSDAYLDAGGALVGATKDALEAENPKMTPGAQSVGSHHSPNAELIYALEPDFVLLSADFSSHLEIGANLEKLGVTCVYLSTKDYRSYMEMFAFFTQLTGREDLYQHQLETVQRPIEEIIAEEKASADYNKRSALLLRAYSTGVKAKSSADSVAGTILKDMGFENLADGDSPLSENLSLEAILIADPDYIFVAPMGDSAQAAMDSMEEFFTGNPAWAGLTAVQNGRYIVLDPALFHRHPNARWAQSYAFIRDLLHGGAGQ